MNDNPQYFINCKHCNASYHIEKSPSLEQPRFCIQCGHTLSNEEEIDTSQTSEFSVSHAFNSVSFIAGLIPNPEEIKYSIGPYQIIDSIGKGGMGEVLLAYDTVCGRRIALKRIREDLFEFKQLHHRFLKEAHITSQLTHPAIIPIYSIHQEENLIYYTMPFVEGETLKQILREARKQDKKDQKSSSHMTSSIPSLMRIFLTICNAVAYSHAKGVLHRDLKPENIIIGQYGEVMILDWGLAKLMDVEETIEMGDFETISTKHELTRVGKVVGTVAYMAPERALGNPATIQTDIYSLGVILYQMLTLHPPFKRGTLQEFRKKLAQEKLRDPAEVAPYRDIPKALSQIAIKCLDFLPENRYKSIQDLISDLENFIEGRSEWFSMAKLNIQRKSDWEFQENVLISEHIAITRNPDVTEWVSLMISNASFNGNTRVKTHIKPGKGGHGIGIMLSVPEIAERKHINEGYCLWLATDLSNNTKLLRSTLEVVNRPDIVLQREEWYTITIDKIENNIHVYINDVLQFSYISHLPMTGTHIGILSRDADFELSEIEVFVSSLNILVNCLAVPDAFLAHKEYAVALSEYRRIAYSFPGRAEGREALFKAGITLLEQARNTSNPTLYESALDEFSKQHSTPGAPLEYLGKALVYQAQGDVDEEIKCYEMAFRRYPGHPLLHILHEQIIHRMNETSKSNRKAAYHFILLCIRYLPKSALANNVRKFFTSLQRNWEPLDFVLTDKTVLESQALADRNFCLKLGFWLARPYVIVELIEELLNDPKPSIIVLSNAIYCLLEVGSVALAEQQILLILETLAETDVLDENKLTFQCLSLALSCLKGKLKEMPSKIYPLITKQLDPQIERLIYFVFREALKIKDASFLLDFAQGIAERTELNYEQRLKVDKYKIWTLLLEKKWSEAGALLHCYPYELLSHENSILHFLYGCWLLVSEGKEIADVHFSGVIEVANPHSWMLLASDIGKISDDSHWQEKAFMWEKRNLFQQLALFYHCTGEEELSFRYYQQELKEYLDVEA